MTKRISRVGCYGVAVDRGRVLLTLLRTDDPGGHGFWTLPGGGADWGEDPEDTLRREVYEETGLVATDVELLEVRSWVGPLTGEAGEIHHYHLIYRMTAVGEPVVIEVDGSTADARWVAVGDLPTGRLVPGFADLIGSVVS